jgi:hypothetical protein
LGNPALQTPFGSQYCSIGSQGAFAGQVLHGAPHALPLHGSTTTPPEAPPLVEPPAETPPLVEPPAETPPLVEPPFDEPPFPVSPASPALGSSSPLVDVDCPPHAAAKTSATSTDRTCLLTTSNLLAADRSHHKLQVLARSLGQTTR